jgi:hypothetical protein
MIEKHSCEFVLASDVVTNVDPATRDLAGEAWSRHLSWGDANRTLVTAGALADMMDGSGWAGETPGWNRLLRKLRDLDETYVDLEN